MLGKKKRAAIKCCHKRYARTTCSRGDVTNITTIVVPAEAK
jgi:hypothetical protein